MILFLNMRVISMFAVSKRVVSPLVTWLELETDHNMLIICYSKFFYSFQKCHMMVPWFFQVNSKRQHCSKNFTNTSFLQGRKEVC